MTTAFFVPGVPAPKGSLKAIPFRRKTGKLGVSVKHDNPKVKTWMANVALIGRRSWKGEPTDDELRVELVFLLPRPKTVKREWPSAKPDIDKLARAILDALEGVVFTNDSRVVQLDTSKEYAEPELGDEPGVNVWIRRPVRRG
jgi:Holliday junction resolvase RusA-like endonuclease